MTMFTMDTGSTGIIAGWSRFPVNGQTALGPGSVTYRSSGITYTGSYYTARVGIYDNPTAAQPVTTATVVALRADNDATVAYMGIGFGHEMLGSAYGNSNVFTAANGPNYPSNYSPGYIITNSGVQLGLTSAKTAGFGYVSLTRNGTPGGVPDWAFAPMTIAIGRPNGTPPTTLSGSFIPDTGIYWGILYTNASAQLNTTSCATGKCLAGDQTVSVFLPGQNGTVATYDFTTGVESALRPDGVRILDQQPYGFNSGREFYAGFDVLYDWENGFVGYRWNGNVSGGRSAPMLVLRGAVTLPDLMSSSFSTYLLENTTLSSPGSVLFQGNLIGPGGLTIASGDFALAGTANTYQGGTTINGGSLSLGPGATLPQSSSLTMNGGTFNLNGNTQVLSALGGNGGTVNFNNGWLVLDTTQSNTLGASLSGNGMFTIQGGGSLNLTGNSSGFSGNTAVSNASLAVNGSLGGNVFVTTGGTVSGTGTFTGNLYNGGVLSPGNSSVGTLTVAGNFYNPGGVVTAEVTGSGLADQVVVNGTASLQGGAVYVTALPGINFGPSTTYKLVTAAGGLSGTFSSVNEIYPFLQSSLSYDANNAYLTLSIGGFAAAGGTPAQSAVGAVLDANVGSATGDFANVLSALAINVTSPAQAQAVLQAISGNNYAGFSSYAVQGAQLFMNNFANQAGGQTGGGAPASTRVALAEACDVACDTASPPKWGAWGGGLGGFGTIGAGQPVGGVTYNAGGFAAGLDRLVTDTLRVGVTAGYSAGTQWVNGFTGMGRSDTFQTGLYANFAQDKVYADALLGYAYTWNQMWRQIAIPGLQSRTAYGATGANQFFGQIETGYRFDLGTNANAFITPFARLQAYTGNQNAFTETGAQSLSLTVNGQGTNSLRTVLGAQIGGAMDLGWREKLAMQLRLGWSHEYADVSRPVTATLAGAPAMPFTTWGVSPQRDGALIGLNANTAIADATSVYFRYEGLVSGQDNAHAFTAGLRMTW